jgi:adenylate kinase family enzyme
VRVVVIGNSGSGKSTYARRVAARHQLAYLELDVIVWEPRQVAVARPATVVRAELDGFLAAHDRWVIEGCDGDLAERALPAASELVLLDPGQAVCVDHNRRRPWEPHKYDSAEAQDRMLPFLLQWVADYYRRDDARSLAYHRRLFDAHPGAKRALVALPPDE